MNKKVINLQNKDLHEKIVTFFQTYSYNRQKMYYKPEFHRNLARSLLKLLEKDLKKIVNNQISEKKADFEKKKLNFTQILNLIRF